MAFWKKLFKDETEEKVDYYAEGLDLQRTGRYHEALTSFRLALRDAPSDAAVLQQIAVTYTRIGMTDEAIKTYRQALAHDPGAAGAHYGLGFLMLHAGRRDEALEHLRAFLDAPPESGEAGRHIEHARQTVEELVAEDAASAGGEAGAEP